MTVPTWLGHRTAVKFTSLFLTATRGADRWMDSSWPAQAYKYITESRKPPLKRIRWHFGGIN